MAFLAGLVIAVVLFTMVVVAITLDLTPMAYLIPGVFGALGVGTGYYFTKAKVENRIKLMKRYGVEPSKESFNDDGDSNTDYYGYG